MKIRRWRAVVHAGQQRFFFEKHAIAAQIVIDRLEQEEEGAKDGKMDPGARPELETSLLIPVSLG